MINIRSVSIESFVFRQEWTKNFIKKMIDCKDEFDLKLLWLLNKHKLIELKYTDNNNLINDLINIKNEIKLFLKTKVKETKNGNIKSS